MLMPEETFEHFNDAIYYPLLLIVLERDRSAIEIGDFKFKSPYQKLIERAETLIRADLKQSNAYFRKHKMKLNKLGNDGSFTEYEFIHGGYVNKRRYSNIRLRNRTEELLEHYLMKGEVNNG